MRWILLGIAGVMLVAHSLAYNFVTDDAYISFVYSRNLAEHGQLAFNLGDAVEGYTNFSWTVLLGLLMLIGIPPEISSRVLGTACGLVTLYVVFRTCERALGRKTAWAAVPPLLLACSSGFACWTSGGLETQLFTMLCAIAVDGIVAAEVEPEHSGRMLRRACIALALAAMTRPEGLLIAALIGAVRFGANVKAARKWIGRADVIAVAWFMAIWAPWFAWRWWYYGWPFPNTYYVKASGAWGRPDLADQMWQNGLYYDWVWLKQTGLVYASALGIVIAGVLTPRTSRALAAWGCVVLAGAMIVITKRASSLHAGAPVLIAAALAVGVERVTPRAVLAAACVLVGATYLEYAASVGGDFMGLHRFIMPVFVAAAIGIGLGLEYACARLPEAWRLYASIAAGAVVVLAFAVVQLGLTKVSTASCAGRQCPNDRGIDSPAFLVVYTEDRAAIGRAMADCVKPDDFAILGGAGAQPYFGRMRGIDVFGLVSARIAHDEPRTNPRAGHTKWGTDNVLTTYDPTFVMSCYQIHPDPKPPPLPCSVGFWIARGYEQVTIHVPELREKGTYYTFLAKKARDFQCPNRVH